MYRNNNHYWKKSFNTTNVEVVIDDPLQIQDTYITNSVYFSNIAVFDKTANDFVYQTPASNNSSVVYQTQGTVIATGVPGDGAVTVDSELGVIGAAIHTGPIGTSGGTGGTGDDGGFVGPPGPRECVELFNKFLALIRKLERHLTYMSLLDLLKITKYWFSELDKDHELYQFLACIIEKESGKWRLPFESPLDYIRRVKNDPGFPGDLPFVLPNIIPYIPGIPSSVDGIERWFELYPNLLENFERDLKEALEKLREERQNQDILSQVSESCREKYKRVLDRLVQDYQQILQLLDLLFQIKKAFDELKNSPCWEILNLDEEFDRRQIGRFGTLTEFFKWLTDIVRPMFDLDPFNDIDPNTDPVKLSDIQSTTLINARYGNIPNRYELSYAQYQSWANQSVETRSFYPPVKGLFRAFDGASNMTDEDAYTGLLHYLTMNFTDSGYRGNLFKDTDWNDIILHLSIFAAQPANSFIPPSWRQTP